MFSTSHAWEGVRSLKRQWKNMMVVEVGGTLEAEASSGPASWERQVVFALFLVYKMAAAENSAIGRWRRKWRFCIKSNFPVVVCCEAFFKSFGRFLCGRGFFSELCWSRF